MGTARRNGNSKISRTGAGEFVKNDKAVCWVQIKTGENEGEIIEITGDSCVKKLMCK